MFIPAQLKHILLGSSTIDDSVFGRARPRQLFMVEHNNRRAPFCGRVQTKFLLYGSSLVEHSFVFVRAELKHILIRSSTVKNILRLFLLAERSQINSCLN